MACCNAFRSPRISLLAAIVWLILAAHLIWAQERIDLNKATVEELQRLPSIGPVLARRIVEHREKHGPFKRPQDVIAIRGVSAKRYRQIAHLLMVR